MSTSQRFKADYVYFRQTETQLAANEAKIYHFVFPSKKSRVSVSRIVDWKDETISRLKSLMDTCS